MPIYCLVFNFKSVLRMAPFQNAIQLPPILRLQKFAKFKSDLGYYLRKRGCYYFLCRKYDALRKFKFVASYKKYLPFALRVSLAFH